MKTAGTRDAERDDWWKKKKKKKRNERDDSFLAERELVAEGEEMNGGFVRRDRIRRVFWLWYV